MKITSLSVALASALLLVSANANAADLPARPAPYAAPVATAYNWTGIYLGLRAHPRSLDS